ncbi:MAG: 3-isopropylmalate dehydratase large subunit [Luminiphilus sp.]|jgi:3-isopropylmalate/(R)-2-methylmalate dehydratase large subunit|nr:3-isopropylmalate dehydratase large subunit [Luminiphilus sp.]
MATFTVGQTLFDKLWQLHEVQILAEGQSLLYVDRIFLHERTGSVALNSLIEGNRGVRRREHTFCTMDHIVDTLPGRGDDTQMPSGRDFIVATRGAAQDTGIQLFDVQDPDQGIVHVISPELGIVLPGMSLVCPDSHTCTLGGLGALAWGVGSTEAEHALATSTLRVNRPQSMRVTFTGALPSHSTAKDLILFAIRELSAAGGAGCAIEFSGSAISDLSVESRLTLCNMSTELSAFTGLIAPDEKVAEYCQGRRFAPEGAAWESAVEHWRRLRTDPSATFDYERNLSIDGLQPQISWGTSPQHCIDWDGVVPRIAGAPDEASASAWQRAQDYMGVSGGSRLSDYPLDAVFIGSCTNSRLSDLRLAADYLRRTGHRVAKGVAALCVPGSGQVKRAAEAEGLDEIFRSAGFEWREPGCSMCFFAGGESFGKGVRVASTTNRNFEGRQGLGVRTHLASPVTVVSSACAGYLVADAPMVETAA